MAENMSQQPQSGKAAVKRKFQLQATDEWIVTDITKHRKLNVGRRAKARQHDTASADTATVSKRVTAVSKQHVQEQPKHKPQPKLRAAHHSNKKRQQTQASSRADKPRPTKQDDPDAGREKSRKVSSSQNSSQSSAASDSHLSIGSASSSRMSSPEASLARLSLNTKSKEQLQPPTFKATSRRSAAERLQGAKFRMLNEKLYTTTGNEAYRWFSQAPQLFDTYHEGFRTQVARWPENPLERMIAYVRSHPKSKVIGDFGCGEARLAQSVPHKVHSFDLVAVNEHITACDIANVPLPPASLDVAIFCLALMGTNYVDYLREAHRVLKKGGHLRIAEVKSRISDTNGFISIVEKTGFSLIDMDDSNKMFIDLHFVKRGSAAPVDSTTAQRILGPCIYKRR